MLNLISPIREGKGTDKERITEINAWQSQAVQLSNCADIDVYLDIYNVPNKMKQCFYAGQTFLCNESGKTWEWLACYECTVCNSNSRCTSVHSGRFLSHVQWMLGLIFITRICVGLCFHSKVRLYDMWAHTLLCNLEVRALNEFPGFDGNPVEAEVMRSLLSRA